MFTLELDEPSVEAVDRAGRELRAGAATDSNGCMGYFPGLRDVDGIRGDLPACRALAATLPTITMGGMTFEFNFARVSLIRQAGDPAFHLDSDAATAVTGDLSTLDARLVRRALLNLNAEHARTLHYLDVDPATVELRAEGAYVRIAEPDSVRHMARQLVIPPRDGNVIHGVDFYANKVMHSGVDDEFGHFVAGYGYEVNLSPQASRCGGLYPSELAQGR